MGIVIFSFLWFLQTFGVLLPALEREGGFHVLPYRPAHDILNKKRLVCGQAYQGKENTRMNQLWYDRPAFCWNEALPLGNGSMGAMCFGGTLVDRFQLNDDTLWSGGTIDRINPDAWEGVCEARRLLREGRVPEAEEAACEMIAATPDGQRAYEPLCDLIVQLRNPEDGRYASPFSIRDLCGVSMNGFEPAAGVEDYRRELSLDEGVHTVSYRLNGASHRRESFISYPAGVMAVSLQGGEVRAMLRRAGRVSAHRAVDGRTVCLEGTAANGGVSFCCALRAVGGEVRRAGDMLCLQGNGVLYAASATSLREGEDYLAAALRKLDAAEAMGYDALKAQHLSDFTPRMNACRLTLDASSSPTHLPHDARLRLVQEGREDFGLICDLFAYGRYLLLCSSRPGSLPANLQGIWNESYAPTWDSKFTININTEMNYWPAESCALSETHEALFDHIRRMVPRGRETAQRMYHARGWMAHHNTDVWADCAPQDNYAPSTFWQMGAAWLSLHLWEHYQYTEDRAFLKENYPIMREAALFFLDTLEEDEHGHVWVSPSISPENTYRLPDGITGCLCSDAAMDQQILWELLTAVVQAGCILGDDVSAFEQLLPRLRPVEISAEGLVREWLDPLKAETELGHRHISHLFALYPGKQITAAQPERMAAARKTLERRLAHGGGHTGWSRAWIIHFYARLLDGEKAGEHIRLLLERSTLPNLLDNHPPFQIDGNFGLTSAIAEMLVQSHEGFLRLAPALPPAWPDGEITGLRARGGYQVDLSWHAGKLTRAVITASHAGEVRLWDGRRIPHAAGEKIVL